MHVRVRCVRERKGHVVCCWCVSVSKIKSNVCVGAKGMHEMLDLNGTSKQICCQFAAVVSSCLNLLGCGAQMDAS